MTHNPISLFALASVLFLASIGARAENQKHDLSGPYVYKNLAVYLIHGKNTFAMNNLLTLKEAIEQKKIIIHETGNVNELAVQNISNNYIFIQEGDIVKGGRQDRIFQYDMVVKPKSGRIPISSFCVEQSRWSKRGREAVDEFQSSDNRVASKKLRLASKEDRSQQEVWQEVVTVQGKLSAQMGRTVNSGVSASSLQLALEDTGVAQSAQDYIDAINKTTKVEKNVIGFVFAINGEINSADVYGNSALFKKMWPKLLEACAIEAISESRGSTQARAIPAQEVSKWMDEVESGKKSNKSVDGDTEFKIKDSQQNILYETYTKDNQEQWIHKNMIKK